MSAEVARTNPVLGFVGTIQRMSESVNVNLGLRAAGALQSRELKMADDGSRMSDGGFPMAEGMIPGLNSPPLDIRHRPFKTLQPSCRRLPSGLELEASRARL